MKKAAFVDVEKYSNGKIAVCMQYYLSNIAGSINKAYLRKVVVDKLLKASKYLSKGYKFLVFDAWRPYAVQKALYDDYFNKLKNSKKYQGYADKKLIALAKEFVSYPEKLAGVSYAHSTGGAVDITILNPSGDMLDMGTKFDDFSKKSHTFGLAENDKNKVAIQNRKLLLDLLQKVGFTNFETEWWHFDYGDKFWAERKNKKPMFTSVYEVEKLNIKS